MAHWINRTTPTALAGANRGTKARWGMRWGLAIAGLLCLPSAALALVDSVGSNGIDARRLHGEPYNVTGPKLPLARWKLVAPANLAG
jgi:hypothetical protein